MPNENHETYGGNDISTYTDDISGSNTFTNEQIEACVLSAGIAPYTAPHKLVVANYTHDQCTGGPNLYSPFYKESNSNILWYDESGLGVLENTNYWWYKHCIYVSKTGNKIASSLKVQNYRNFLEIVTHTWADIRGVQHKTYYPRITTKYGTTGDWNDSVLQPACLIKNTTDGMLAKSVEQTEPQSYWYWGGPSNVQNGMGGGSLFTRDLNNGTVSNDSYAVPWESATSDPIRIKEGGSDYTFPVAFVGEHITSTFYGGNPLNLHQGFNTQDDVLLFCAFCGLKFEYDGTVYKPLANGGVVYGYTNDMSQTSDWDNWRDIGDHVIPVTPPSPGPGPGPEDDDDIDELTFGSYSGGAGAFANVWYTTATELGNLKTWMNKAPGSGGPPQGYNPMDSILSLMIYPIAIPTSGSLVHISFFNPNDPDNHLISSDAQGYFTEGKTFEINLGSYTIDPHHDSDWAYLDYDTAIELYIPFCGVYQIDTQVVMGTTLSAKMWVDPVMGSCTFCAYANDIPVAMGNGQLGVSLPISSQQFSMVQAAIATNRGNFAASAIGTVLGAVASAIAGGMSGSAAAVTKSYGSMQMARGTLTSQAMASQVRQIGRAGFGQGLTGALGTGANAALIGKATGETYNVFRTNKMLAAGNSTAVSGSFGGSQDPWRLPMTPYVKILRERTHVSDMHVSTIGKLHVMGATLNDCSGFTTVVNPDLSGLTDILTQSELAELYTTLSNGVYC